MGTRLYIEDVNTGKSMYSRYKFYGYYEFDAVKRSFTYLLPYLRVYMGNTFGYYSNRELRDAYDMFSCLPGTYDIEMSYSNFSTFCKLYLKDFKEFKSKNDKIQRNIAEHELHIMLKLPGEKLISWC